MASPVTERVFAGRPLQPADRLLVSPFQFLTDGDEHLRLDTFNSFPGSRIVIQGRTLSTDGTVKLFGYAHTPFTDRTLFRTHHPLGAGALLNVSVFLEQGLANIGQCFVRLQLIKGLLANAYVVGTLCQGYITGFQDVAYPGSPIRMSTEDAWHVRTIVGTDPAAGSGVNETVPSGAIWQVQSIATVLTCDATVITRRPLLIIDDVPNGIYCAVPAIDTLIASEIKRVTWALGVPMGTAGAGVSNVHQAFPNFQMLAAASRIRITAENLQAGDNFAAPVFCVREQLEVSA